MEVFLHIQSFKKDILIDQNLTIITDFFTSVVKNDSSDDFESELKNYKCLKLQWNGGGESYDKINVSNKDLDGYNNN